MEDASFGEVIIDGEDVTRLPLSVAYPIPIYAISAYERSRKHWFFTKNSVFPRLKSAKVEQVSHVLKQKLLDRLPKQLSGGQRQRVAIGRAIIPQTTGLL